MNSLIKKFNNNKLFSSIIIGSIIIAASIYTSNSQTKSTYIKHIAKELVQAQNINSIKQVNQFKVTKNEYKSDDCLVKGNISSGGKIYHIPGGQFYDKTIIDTSRGEKWFCSETEAQTAGWRRSQR